MNLTISQRALLALACQKAARDEQRSATSLRDLGMHAEATRPAYRAQELATLGDLIQTSDVVSITHHEDAGVPE